MNVAEFCECGEPKDGFAGCQRCDFLDGTWAKNSRTYSCIVAMLIQFGSGTLDELASLLDRRREAVYKTLKKMTEKGRVFAREEAIEFDGNSFGEAGRCGGSMRKRYYLCDG